MVLAGYDLTLARAEGSGDYAGGTTNASSWVLASRWSRSTRWL
jgi:hypothetical protein